MAQAATRFNGRDGEPVVVLLSDQRYSFDAAGRSAYTHRLVYRILSAAADQSWSAVERSWSPWHQARPEVRARVITPDGVAHPLDPSILVEGGEAEDSPDMFGDGRVLRGPLPATGPGVVVEQEVTVRDTAPFFDGGTVEVSDVAASVSVQHARVVIEAPATTTVRYVARLLPNAVPRDETVPGPTPLRRLTFDYRDLPASDDAEAGLPPELPRTPYLAFSTGRSWSDIARRYSAVVDQAIRGADMSALIRSAGGPAASQLETMNRLLERLGEIRYTGVELGQGGIVPRTPAETLRRKFGDCKDKAVLLIAALRALDIPAYAALLDAGDDQQDIEPDLPGFGAFNHAIVVVPGSPSLWIDPTERFARAGELPSDDQGRLALVASPTATGLIRTPEAEAGENRTVKTREFFLADQGAAHAVETDQYWGATERDLRSYYISEDPEQLREALSDYVKKSLLAKDLAAYTHANPLDLTHPFQLRLEARETRRGYTDEKAAAVVILPAALLDQLPDEVTSQDHDKEGESRQGDYYFSRPFIAETVYRIVPPPGFAPRPLPASRVRHLGTATLSEDYAAGRDGVVTATLRLHSGKRRITSDEFETLRSAAREVAAGKPVVVQFEQVGETALAAGRVREAIAEFQREATTEPKKALPHCRLARALLAGGLGEAAHQEAESATRLEPRSATAQRTLGWVLQHDAIGRRFGPGYDRAGALAAYRKAKQLDPEDETTRADLGLLLERDAQGRRYTAAADLGAAIAEYQELRTRLKSKAMDNNLLAALLQAGRFADVLALAAEMEDSAAHETARLVATAATAGPETALRDAERRLADTSTLVAALDAAAEELVALRRYPEAAALLARAAQQTPNAAAFLARVDALRRARHHEELPQNPADPAGGNDPGAVARRFLLAALADPASPDRQAAMLAHGLTQDLTPAARLRLLRQPGAETGGAPSTAAGGAGAAGRLRLSPDARQDLALATWRVTQQGDDRLGYRVEVSATIGETPARTALFLVPDKGEYRIAALGDLPATLGLEALRRLAGGDLRGARQWLDWAREELLLAAANPANLEVPAGAAAGAAGTAGTAGAAAPAAPIAANLTGVAEVLPAIAGDEDLPVLPFTVLWGQGSHAASATAAVPAASSAAADVASPAGEARCAAASLVAGSAASLGAGPAALLALLRACRDGAVTETRRVALEMSLADAWRSLGRGADLLASAQRLAAAAPESPAAFGLQAAALAALDRWSDLDALARRRLQARPDDPVALRVASQAAARRGDLETAAALLRRAAAGSRQNAADLNQLAWIAVLRGRPDDQAMADAQRAVELSGFADPAALHTLASLYAERGQPAEAYRLDVQSLDARPAVGVSALPTAGDWYIFGHLAESYGLPDTARQLYARVVPNRRQEGDPLSTFRLAQARLAALGTVKEAAASAKSGHGTR